MGLIKDYGNTLYNWLSKFAPTYREPIREGMFDADNPKPSEYISYSSHTGNFNTSFIQAITVYSKSTAYTKVMDIVDKIEQAVTENGVKVEDDWGYLTIYKGNPFYQDKPDEDSSYSAGYVNLEISVYQYKV